MTTIIVECRRCGHAREISREDLLRGGWSKSCPVCSPDDRDSAEIGNPMEAGIPHGSNRSERQG